MVHDLAGCGGCFRQLESSGAKGPGELHQWDLEISDLLEAVKDMGAFIDFGGAEFCCDLNNGRYSRRENLRVQRADPDSRPGCGPPTLLLGPDFRENSGNGTSGGFDQMSSFTFFTMQFALRP